MQTKDRVDHGILVEKKPDALAKGHPSILWNQENALRSLSKLGYSFCLNNSILPIDFQRISLTVAVPLGKREKTTESEDAIRFLIRKQSNIQTINIAYIDPAEFTIGMNQLSKLIRKNRITSYPQSRFYEALSSVSRRGGSDLYCVYNGTEVNLIGKIDGVTEILDTLNQQDYENDIVATLTTESISHTNNTIPQSGSHQAYWDGIEMNTRLRTWPILAHSFDAFDRRSPHLLMNFRVLPGNDLLPRLDELGFLPSQYEKIIEIMSYGGGKLFLTGLPGSGKTTTLYAILRHYAEKGMLIFSIESPLEAIIKGVIQTEVSSIEESIRYRDSLLQLNPDIVSIGESLGAKEFHFVADFLQTGVPTLTSLHEATALGALRRIASLIPERTEAVYQKITAVCAQKIISPTCTMCSHLEPPSEYLQSRILRHHLPLPKFVRTRRRMGDNPCSICDNKGILGPRFIIAELLEMNQDIISAISLPHWNPHDVANMVYNTQNPSLFMRAMDFLEKQSIDAEEFLKVGEDK